MRRLAFDREKLHRLLDEVRRFGREPADDARSWALDRGHEDEEDREELDRVPGRRTLLDAQRCGGEPFAEVVPGRLTVVTQVRARNGGAVPPPPARTAAELAAVERVRTFQARRVDALDDVLAHIADDELRSATLAAADPAVARRSFSLHGNGTTADGRAMWRAAERRAASVYRRAYDTAEVAGDDLLLEQALQRCGSGHALPAPLRAHMERELGFQLDGVHIHTDSVAAAAANAMRASAFTVGEDIFFAEGAFRPDTPEGLQLLAHELTHVVQAYQGRTTHSAGITVSRPDDSLEREAESMAARLAISTPHTGGPTNSQHAAPAAAPHVDTRATMLLRQATPDAAHGAPPPSQRDVAAPETSTKATYRRKTEVDWHIGAVPAKLSMRWEISRKDRTPLSIPVHAQKGKVDYGSQQVLLEKSAKGLDAKVTTSLVKANFDLLADGKLPGDLGTLPLVPKVEVKGLEGGLSIKDGLDVKLLTLSVYLEGDFSQFFEPSTRQWLEVKGQVRIECALEPELAKQIVELAKAGDAIKRSVEVEKEIARLERQLEHPRLAKDTKRELEHKLKKLRRVREGVSKARDAALRKVEQIGKLLDKSPAGKLVKKLGHKALAKVFTKFIPIVNILSTAQDLYEAGKFLAGLDWGRLGDRIINGGDGGTTFDEGSHDGGTPGGGDGFGEGGAGDATGVDPDAIERELEQEAHPELHAAAQAIVDALEKPGDDAGPSVKLLDEDKETLNHVVPHDLTPDEIEIVKSRLTTATAHPQDLVTSVIEVVQQVRPFGQQRFGPPKTPAPSTGGEDVKAKNAGKSTRPNRREQQRLDQARGTWIVDPAEVLRRVISVDEEGNVMVPHEVDFGSFTANARKTGVARFSLGTGEDGTETSFLVRVEIVPRDPPPGVLFVDGSAVQNRAPVTVVVIAAARRRPLP